MRCEHDTHTAELPGLPARPIRPPRTTQPQRMQLMGYEGPKERKRCESCVHSWGDSYPMIRCNRGDFPVHRGGLCGEWEQAR